jgi:signal transduction histidine kinase
MARLLGDRLTGIALVAFTVVSAAVISFRLAASGPDWGLHLRLVDHRVIADEVHPSSLAWNLNVRPGQQIAQIDGQDALGYVGSDLKSATSFAVLDATGHERSVRVPTFPDGFIVALFVGALLFVGLGTVVFRWAADARLGLAFLMFGWAVAMTLVSIPAAALGHPLGFLLAAPSAVVASSSFFILFLIFPRPLRGARSLIPLVIVVTVILVGAIAAFILTGTPFPRAFDSILWLWVALDLLGGLFVLGLRIRRQDDRLRFAPIIVGATVGVIPVVVMNALPFAISRVMILPVEFTPIGLVGIPLGFTYAILYHRLFALDALVRRILFRFVDVAILVSLVMVIWAIVRRTTIGESVAGIVTLTLAALVASALSPRLRDAIDKVLYGQIFQARNRSVFRTEHTVQDLGLLLTRQIRELVPVQWAAFIGREAAPTEMHPPTLDGEPRPGVVVAVDGEVPLSRLRGRWVAGRLVWIDNWEERRVIPVASGTRTLGAVVVGPRLNNSSLNGLDLETIQLLVSQAASAIEAALLREQAEEERRFRDGLSGFARELAAAGSVEQVLQITAIRAEQFLRSDVSLIWLRAGTGQFTLAASDGSDFRRFMVAPEMIPWAYNQVQTSGSAGPLVFREKHVVCPDIGTFSRILYRLGDVGNALAIGMMIRQGVDNSFSVEDERRAGEIVEHADGAFRRAYAFAQAAEAETLREITRVRGEFLDVVSHDLQNPLAVIRGFAELLEIRLSGANDALVTNAIASISEATTTCHRLIEDILTSSRAERGRLSLQRQAVDLDEFLPRLVQNYRVLPGSQRIRVETTEPVKLLADVARLEQMVGNLITNALRYSESGPIILRARILSPGDGCIEVRDYGRGIAPEDQSKIWDRFYRTPSSESGTPRGVGVGLSIVRTLAELHGGRAEVESAPGEGSLFRIVLPLSQTPACEESDPPKSEGKGPTVAA